MTNAIEAKLCIVKSGRFVCLRSMRSKPSPRAKEKSNDT